MVPIVMFGWILVSIVAFGKKEPRDAIIIVVVGGVLFLPMYAFKLPGIPEYTKVTAIAYCLLIGEFSCGQRRQHPVTRSSLDLPMVVWCFISPIATSLSNGLGLYNGVSNAIMNFLTWGVFYWMGRRYFSDATSMRKLTLAIVVGGLMYFPLMAFEVRMSPQLSRMVYGFFPHSFLQHMRYGSFRPIVFMQHGLMVALWSAVSAISAYWLWRSRTVVTLMSFPMSLLTMVMIVGTILCKSVGALILMAVGLASFSFFKKSGSTRLFKVMLLLSLFYISFRISNILPISTIESTLEKYFDAERVQSALMRMTEEDLFGARAMLRPILGWGGYQRGWPIDPDTGQKLIGMVDALWIMLFSSFGLLGLISAFLSLGIGPWKVLREYARRKTSPGIDGDPIPIDGIILSLVVTLYILDSLLNAMHNPVYILCAGALVSYSLSLRGSKHGA
jgi:hypothetical protein